MTGKSSMNNMVDIAEKTPITTIFLVESILSLSPVFFRIRRSYATDMDKNAATSTRQTMTNVRLSATDSDNFILTYPQA